MAFIWLDASHNALAPVQPTDAAADDHVALVFDAFGHGVFYQLHAPG